jgi:protoporphyrinogen/coproporphyrinogen III oxidase
MTSHVPAIIVGGGISGLVCAYALRKAGVDALLIEASDRPGGVIRTERREGYLLELGPQSFSGTPALHSLCCELSLENELLEAPPRAPRYVFVQRALRRVPLSPPAFFGSSLIGARTKATVVRDILGKSSPPRREETVANFVRRKFTAELLDRLVGPFISGIYAGDPEILSLRSAFPQLYEAEVSTGSVIRGMMRQAKAGKKSERRRPTLQSLREGNETLVRALSTRLGTALRLGTEVARVGARSEGTSRRFELSIRGPIKEETISAEHLILATPTHAAGSLLRDVNSGFESLLGGVRYAPVAIVSLGYRRKDVGHSLEGFGFLVPRSEQRRILGCVWNSSLFPGRAPEGHVLLTSFVGGATDLEAATLSPGDLAALVHGELAPILSIRQAPTFSNVQLYPRALPQYNLGHLERLAELEKLRLDHLNLWFVGNYLRGPSVGACVEQSLAVAEQVLARRQGETR